jgi:hypothetical protein
MVQAILGVDYLGRVATTPADHPEWVTRVSFYANKPAIFDAHLYPASGRADSADPLLHFHR